MNASGRRVVWTPARGSPRTPTPPPAPELTTVSPSTERWMGTRPQFISAMD